MSGRDNEDMEIEPEQVLQQQRQQDGSDDDDEQPPFNEDDVIIDEEGVFEGADDEIDDFSVAASGCHDGHPVFSVKAHPVHSNVVLSGGEDEKAFISRVSDGETIAQLDGHGESVLATAFSRDGKYAATGAMDGTLYVWGVPANPELAPADQGYSEWQQLASLSGPSEVVWIDWHPSGQYLAAGSEDCTVWIWSIPSGDFVHCLTGHAAMVNAGKFAAKGTRLLTGAEDGSLIFWDTDSGNNLVKFQAADGRFGIESITSLAVNSAGTVGLIGGGNGELRLVNLVNGTVVRALEGHDQSIEAIEWIDGIGVGGQGIWITVGVDGNIIAWESQNGAVRWQGKHEDAISSLAVDRARFILATGSVDLYVKVWDARSGKELAILPGNTQPIHDISFTADGKHITCGGDDGILRVFPTIPPQPEDEEVGTSS